MRSLLAKLPKTSVLVAVLTALTASVIAYSASTFSWTDAQTTATSGAALASIALVGFLVEHLRPGTPQRWVGVLGLIPAEFSSVATLGIVFMWWGESALKVSGFVIAIVTPLASIAGVTIAQAKVYSLKTATENVQAVAAAKNVDPETHAR